MDNECAVVNTDIAGIGVRVSFYVQTFFLGVSHASMVVQYRITKRSYSVAGGPFVAGCANSAVDFHLHKLRTDYRCNHTSWSESAHIFPSCTGFLPCLVHAS
jgi:hypothetical protein